jgi:hypothetical protein
MRVRRVDIGSKNNRIVDELADEYKSYYRSILFFVYSVNGLSRVIWFSLVSTIKVMCSNWKAQFQGKATVA